MPEFVPYVGGPRPIVSIISRVFNDSKNAAEQQQGLALLLSRFANKHYADEGARLILNTIQGKKLDTEETVRRERSEAETRVS